MCFYSVVVFIFIVGSASHVLSSCFFLSDNGKIKDCSAVPCSPASFLFSLGPVTNSHVLEKAQPSVTYY